MERKPLNTCTVHVLSDDVPDGLHRRSIAPCFPVCVYPPKQFAAFGIGRLKPSVEESLDPVRRRYGPGVAGFTLQVKDRLAVFSFLPLLKATGLHTRCLVPAQATCKQKGQKRSRF